MVPALSLHSRPTIKTTGESEVSNLLAPRKPQHFLLALWLRAACKHTSLIYIYITHCEERRPEASLAHKSFPWCCPKCLKKGKAALEKMLVKPAAQSGAKRKRMCDVRLALLTRGPTGASREWIGCVEASGTQLMYVM